MTIMLIMMIIMIMLINMLIVIVLSVLIIMIVMMVVSSKVLRIAGGMGKRARATAVAGETAVRGDDRDTVKACFAFDVASFKTWFKARPVDNQVEFLRMAKTYKQNPERLMNHAAGLAPEVVALEVVMNKEVCLIRGLLLNSFVWDFSH